MLLTASTRHSKYQLATIDSDHTEQFIKQQLVRELTKGIIDNIPVQTIDPNPEMSVQDYKNLVDNRMVQPDSLDHIEYRAEAILFTREQWKEVTIALRDMCEVSGSSEVRRIANELMSKLA